ncbi:MAG: Ni/Fe hydrogenase subunit alpha [Actinobacteria bacterium]|nr:MAG: Ni/Fe hydrogenase subunit alpha [Actinomycetota bacterium]
MSTRSVRVHHLSRVEGHGDIDIRVAGGKIEHAAWEVVETPRYFEVMLKGKHYSAAALLTSRICGICSIGHTLASLRATENALGVTVPPAAAALRLLAKHGETLQSHYLHLFFLVAPDFLGLPSVLPLLKDDPELVDIARGLKGLGNKLSELAAGRATHPVSLQVGGVTRMPEKHRLLEMKTDLERSLGWVEKTLDLFSTIQIPSFSRETEYVSLAGSDSYPWIGGDIVSSDGIRKGEPDYLDITNEYVTESNTSKWTRLSRESYAVGALARVNNNFELLPLKEQELARSLALSPVCHNPFMNNVAQLIECVNVTHDSIRLIEQLLDETDKQVMAEVKAGAGRGVGAVEVPRGILFHDYEYDDSGRIVKANCVIPTTQNNANIHFDLAALAGALLAGGADDDEIERVASMLVRAYDPCISCSVH